MENESRHVRGDGHPFGAALEDRTRPDWRGDDPTKTFAGPLPSALRADGQPLPAPGCGVGAVRKLGG
jgi:hypothetical protein